MKRWPVAVPHDYTAEEIAELNRPQSPADKVRARRELVDLVRLHVPDMLPAAEALLLKAEQEESGIGPGLPLVLPSPRKPRQIAFPFPVEYLPSPAGEGRSSSPGSAAAPAALVREPSPRGRRSPQGTRLGARSPYAWSLALALLDAQRRRGAST